jgi:hypothetical protein
MERNKKKKKAKKGKMKYDLNLIQKIAGILEAGHIEEFIDIKSRPWRLMMMNFWIGIFRGIGFFLGATVIGAVLLALAAAFVKKYLGGMPWIGEKIAEALVYINALVKEYSAGGK